MGDNGRPPAGYGLTYIRQLRAGRSPVFDLIEQHRAEMARIWERHVAELSRADGRAA